MATPWKNPLFPSHGKTRSNARDANDAQKDIARPQNLWNVWDKRLIEAEIT